MTRARDTDLPREKPPPDGIRVSLDLQIHGITQAKALVPELVHEFGVEVAGGVHVTDGLEKTQRK
jgi:hypothetical protein